MQEGIVDFFRIQYLYDNINDHMNWFPSVVADTWLLDIYLSGLTPDKVTFIICEISTIIHSVCLLVNATDFFVTTTLASLPRFLFKLLSFVLYLVFLIRVVIVIAFLFDHRRITLISVRTYCQQCTFVNAGSKYIEMVVHVAM